MKIIKTNFKAPFHFSSKHSELKTLLVFLSAIIVVITATVAAAQSTHNFRQFLNNKKYDSQRVVKIISADTFELESGEKVKLIGLKAPEAPPSKKKKVERDDFGFVIKDKPSPIITVEDLAYEFVSDLILDKKVRLEFDVRKTDDTYITLAYVFLEKNNLFVNAEILKHGFSALHIQPPNLKYATKLKRAYQKAHQDRVGLHNE